MKKLTPENLFQNKSLKSTLEKLKGYSEESSEEVPTVAEIGAQFGLDTESIDNLTKDFSSGVQQKFDIKFVNKSTFDDPHYQYDTDSGMDLRANIESPLTLGPMERTLVPTGVFFQLPQDYEIQVRPRSGLTLKHGISVLNTPGTVDNGYRGEIKVILINLSNEEYTLKPGERIAQAVINYVLSPRWINLRKVDNLDGTSRSDKGFGSTGKL
tara:strand:- start:399 stop:1034 length:636 start_codon:yes stop_codon:yes gene_type:complete